MGYTIEMYIQDHQTLENLFCEGVLSQQQYQEQYEFIDFMWVSRKY